MCFYLLEKKWHTSNFSIGNCFPLYFIYFQQCEVSVTLKCWNQVDLRSDPDYV